MPPSRLFAPHLPSLRRYASAVSDSPEMADSLLYVALSGLAAVTIPDDVDPRLIMYRAFYRKASSLGAGPEQTTSDDAMGRRHPGVMTAAPGEWMTFLLLTMEDFTDDETAFITGRSEAEVEDVMRRWAHAAAASGCFGNSNGNACLTDVVSDLIPISVDRERAGAVA